MPGDRTVTVKMCKKLCKSRKFLAVWRTKMVDLGVCAISVAAGRTGMMQAQKNCYGWPWCLGFSAATPGSENIVSYAPDVSLGPLLLPWFAESWIMVEDGPGSGRLIPVPGLRSTTRIHGSHNSATSSANRPSTNFAAGLQLDHSLLLALQNHPLLKQRSSLQSRMQPQKLLPKSNHFCTGK